MSIFDQPLSKKSSRPAAQKIAIRAAYQTDAPKLAELELLCMRRLKKGEDKKFVQWKTEASIDPDFDVELLPEIIMQKEKGFAQRIVEQCGRFKFCVVTRGDEILACFMMDVDNVVHAIDLGMVLLHPEAPPEAMETVWWYITNYAERCMKDMEFTYYLPDLLDTSMQRVFLFFKEKRLKYVRKANAYRNVMDAWCFKHTFTGQGGTPKGKKKAV